MSDARSAYDASPATREFGASLSDLDWQAADYVPLSRDAQAFGEFVAHLPPGMAAPARPNWLSVPRWPIKLLPW